MSRYESTILQDHTSRVDRSHESCTPVYRHLLQPTLPAHPPTVNSKNFSTNIATRPARQEHNTALEVIRATPSSGRDSRQDALRPLLIIDQRRVHLSRDIARCNGVDADALRGPLVAQRLGELCNTALASGVGRHCQAALEAKQRCNVDDRASTAVRVCFSGKHVRANLTTECEDSAQVNLQHVVPVIVGELV